MPADQNAMAVSFGGNPGSSPCASTTTTTSASRSAKRWRVQSFSRSTASRCGKPLPGDANGVVRAPSDQRLMGEALQPRHEGCVDHVWHAVPADRLDGEVHVLQ